MTEGVRAFAIVLAAGEGRRLDAGAPKALVRIGGEAIVTLAVRAAATSCAEGVVVAAPADLVEDVRALVEPSVLVVEGGATRQDSVRRGLEAVPRDVAVVAVLRCLEAEQGFGGGGVDAERLGRGQQARAQMGQQLGHGGEQDSGAGRRRRRQTAPDVGCCSTRACHSPMARSARALATC